MVEPPAPTVRRRFGEGGHTLAQVGERALLAQLLSISEEAFGAALRQR